MRLLLRIIIFPITLILSILIAFSKFIVTIGGTILGLTDILSDELKILSFFDIRISQFAQYFLALYS